MADNTLAGKKIMVVDDDDLVQRMFSTYLQKSGATVIDAHDGEEALAKLKEGSCDLIMLDLVMPKLDGCDTLERIKADPVLAKIPVMVLTNLDDKAAHIDRAKALGVKEYIKKTDISLDEVVGRVQEMLAS